jgi:DNA topoisomerase I
VLNIAMSIGGLPPGLVYVGDEMPGIVRRRRGTSFSYVDAEGRVVDAEVRRRCVELAIPPAWERVWICADPAGHIQATGFDAAGRKQYRYHPGWSAWRAEAKYGGLAAFGRGLARLRARIERDLAGDAGDQAFSLAAITVLLDRVHLRIGSTAHTARNRTFGATTLQPRHLKLDGEVIRLRYRAKGGRMTEHRLRDRRLHRILEAIHDLPGRTLFTWIDADGAVHGIASQQVNRYLAESTGVAGATAKTFRTWAGTLAAFGVARSATGRLAIRAMAEAAAARLHNTPTIARSAYIHPAVAQLAEIDPAARADLLARLEPTGPRRLRADERRLIALLESTPCGG